MNGDETKERIARFQSFFMNNYPRVKAFAWKLLKSEEDAEDIAQDIFTKLWSEPELWESRDKWDSYLYAMTRNHIYNFINHQAIEANYAETIAKRWNDLQEDIPDLNDELYARELSLLIKMAVEKMPEQRKCVFRLSKESGLSNPEIAERMGLSVRTVERHLYLAIRELKKIIPYLIFLVFPLSK